MSMYNTGSKTLSEFVDTIQDIQIREALMQYTRHGMMGHLLDADEDGLSLGEFSVFEIEELMNLGEKYALPVLLYLFRRIERSLPASPLQSSWTKRGSCWGTPYSGKKSGNGSRSCEKPTAWWSWRLKA